MTLSDLQAKLREIKSAVKTLNRQIKFLDQQIFEHELGVTASKLTIEQLVDSEHYKPAKNCQKAMRMMEKDIHSLGEVRATIYLERERLGRRCIAIRRVLRERDYATMARKKRAIKRELQ